MKIRNLAFSAAGMALFALASFAQITGVEGVVKGPDGKVVQGAIIKIHRTDIKGDYATKPTDKRGHYIYNGLPIGTYDLSLWIAGKQVDELKNVRTSRVIRKSSISTKKPLRTRVAPSRRWLKRPWKQARFPTNWRAN